MHILYTVYLCILDISLEETIISVFNWLHGQDFLQGFEQVTLKLKMRVNANERQQHPEAAQVSRCMRNTVGARESDLHTDKPWSLCSLYGS